MSEGSFALNPDVNPNTRRQRTYRTQAIILKRRNLGEADRLLTLLTPDHGKIDAVAKGARKPASKKTGHVELFTRAEVLLSKGRELDILVQAEMTEPYLPLREELGRGAYASYVVELLDRFTFDGDVHQGDLYTLLEETLTRLSYDGDIRRAVRYFELYLLDSVGFRPELTECVITREAVEPIDQYFSYAEGGVVAPESRHLALATVPISVNALKVLRHMQRSPYVQVAALKITPDLHTELERIMLGYIQYTLENKLQSVDFIQRLRRMTAAD
ncbi:DNA repair protein RecO [Phototrophicus methaneseepsis]|uniref:DNA repair protein RecO n=1 Tax=Phototrophicus methaneseepsis TaxID=2710758 RepID=A0A7S8IF17_9CHLR|nr:DNA repair protein RecO [Phototrophicus methaneseepsis]QPC84255.1 DNA repair protein RecO [Phototrophicus methaneseepsis]